MVNAEIPKHYTASPSSLSGTPHLTINRETTFDLDSSNAFEGPEKLLEVWFAPSGAELPPTAGPLGLKMVSASVWTDMLDMVHCRVLSIIESQDVDAYLLSESSMFVYPHKLVLKTCGTTTLLLGIPKMLEIAALKAGFPHSPAYPERGLAAAASTHQIFYSRKNFLYPDQQRGPHRSWRDEVRALDRIFRRGSAYMIGKMNGEHWYLYITEPIKALTPPLTPNYDGENISTETRLLEVPENMAAATANALKGEAPAQDETLEILMTDLDEDNAKQFYLDSASAVAESQYFENLHKARQCSADALANVHKSGPEDFAIEDSHSTDESEFVGDVFDQTNAHLDDALLPSELFTEGHALGSVVSENCGLANLYPKSTYPDARVDAYLFTPCGFSANGVIPAPTPQLNGHGGSPLPLRPQRNSTHYFTVHVTPEPHCSYASFETNVPNRQTSRQTVDVVQQVVNIFKPGRFSITLFEAKHGSERIVEAKGKMMDAIRGYRRVDRIVHDLDGYDLVFRHFEKEGWQGGAPRLGEAF